MIVCNTNNSLSSIDQSFSEGVVEASEFGSPPIFENPPKFIGGANEGVLIGSDPFETKLVVLKGKSVTIKCLVSGNPEPTIHWTEESVDGADERSPEIISTNSTLVSA